jgi:RALGAPB N-terminal domain
LVGEDRIQGLWRSYLSCVSLIVLTVSKPGDELQAHCALVNDVLDLYLLFASDLGDEIDDKTWMMLQRNLLDTIHDLLSRSSPFEVDQLATTLTDALFHCLFIVWIQSPVTTDAMWQELREKVCTLVEWKSLMVQWKDIMVQLSQIFVELIYTSGLHNNETDTEGVDEDPLDDMDALMYVVNVLSPLLSGSSSRVWRIFIASLLLFPMHPLSCTPHTHTHTHTHIRSYTYTYTDTCTYNTHAHIHTHTLAIRTPVLHCHVRSIYHSLTSSSVVVSPSFHLCFLFFCCACGYVFAFSVAAVLLVLVLLPSPW